MMRHSFVLAAAFFSLTVPGFAAEKTTDTFCPAATPAITAIASIDQSDAQKVLGAARTIVDAYRDCASSAISAGALEPAAHYDQTRAAQYEIVVGRALAKLDRKDEAKAAFTDARKSAASIADWANSSLAYTNSNSAGTSVSHNASHTPSIYHDAGVQIRDAADAELAKLEPPAAK